MGLEIQDMTIYSLLFADDQLLIAQDYEDLEYMTRKLIDEYEMWGLKLNVKKKNSMYGHRRHIKRLTTRRLEGDNKLCTYLGVRLTKDGNYESEINDRINIG